MGAHHFTHASRTAAAGNEPAPVAYASRQALQQQAKLRIAQALAAAIPAGSSLFMTVGTTTEEVARALLKHRGLYVVTNNLNIATILSQNHDCQVVVAGGLVRPDDRGIVGDVAVDMIRQFRVDIGVIGISGIDADGSLFDFDYREVRVSQAILANSRRVYLAADRSKFKRGGMVRLGTVEQVDALFTDAAPPASVAERLGAAGVAVHVAAPGQSCAA